MVELLVVELITKLLSVDDVSEGVWEEVTEFVETVELDDCTGEDDVVSVS